MACSGFEVILSAYADGEATPLERRRLEEHLAGCKACGVRLAIILKSKGILAAMPAPAAPPDLKASLLRAAASVDAPASGLGRAPSRRGQARRGLRETLLGLWDDAFPRYGLAFGLAAFLVVGVWFQKRQDEPVPIDLMIAAHRQYSLAQPLALAQGGQPSAAGQDQDGDESED
ncbi:MAG: zf-HC2 domain-containing protein [Elusimicrobia bacterium]|nr:zf-HC2 domain-containing protein [Elusimicrobiota bacterium]